MYYVERIPFDREEYIKKLSKNKDEYEQIYECSDCGYIDCDKEIPQECHICCSQRMIAK